MRLLIDQVLEKIDYEKAIADIKRNIKSDIKEAKASGAVLGLSGGIDSALVAALASSVTPTLGIIMPDSQITPERETKDAHKIAEQFGLDTIVIDIAPILDTFMKNLEKSSKAQGNLRARIRMSILYYHANLSNRLVLGTGDKSEIILGYFTKFGDGASDITPIAGLYKTQVRRAAKIVKIPEAIIRKQSAPYLEGVLGAESEIGASYEEIDSTLYGFFEKEMIPKDIAVSGGIKYDTVIDILKRVNANTHKYFAMHFVER